jgi:hypothetical protein
VVEAAALDGVGPANQQSAVLQPAHCFAVSFIARPAFSDAAAPGLTLAAALAVPKIIVFLL